jgi:hypothetical protein
MSGRSRGRAWSAACGSDQIWCHERVGATVPAMDITPPPNPFTLLVFVLLAAVFGVAIFAFAFTRNFSN